MISAPIIDLSQSAVWHFFITVLESPTISKILNPIEIPNLVACNPAYASTTNGDATLEWRTDLDDKISPPTSRTTSSKAYLNDCWSKAASK
ncbi:hypothetical protein J1N35_011688 [Gossypium stocksii]|uniref:Uncharacterized protein n=1 Tax=Gossypium stocksii TaxID=47602 RepID=A0A9D3W4Y7_9ROSI|nr:hypothetical protein J1N35_011688 [Gossypium stocksii]